MNSTLLYLPVPTLVLSELKLMNKITTKTRFKNIFIYDLKNFIHTTRDYVVVVGSDFLDHGVDDPDDNRLSEVDGKGSS